MKGLTLCHSRIVVVALCLYKPCTICAPSITDIDRGVYVTSVVGVSQYGNSNISKSIQEPCSLLNNCNPS